MSLFERVLVDIKLRKKRVEEGLVNCIPLPFARFRRFFPGIEQGRYYLISANQKVKAK